MTRPSAVAAPVDVGMRFSAAARARRGSLCGASMQVLVGRVGVDRRHHAVPDPDGPVQHARHGGEAVRRARGVGDDVVTLGVVDVVVDAEDDVRVGRHGALDGGGQDHLARAGGHVAGGVGVRAELSARLDHDVDFEIVPGRVFRISLGECEDLQGVHVQDAVLGPHGAREAAVDRVIGEQVRERAGVGDVVDGDDLEIGARFDGRAHEAAPDAAEAVDGDTR